MLHLLLWLLCFDCVLTVLACHQIPLLRKTCWTTTRTTWRTLPFQISPVSDPFVHNILGIYLVGCSYRPLYFDVIYMFALDFVLFCQLQLWCGHVSKLPFCDEHWCILWWVFAFLLPSLDCKIYAPFCYFQAFGFGLSWTSWSLQPGIPWVRGVTNFKSC